MRPCLPLVAVLAAAACASPAVDAPYVPAPATELDAAIAAAAPIAAAWAESPPHGVVDPVDFDASLCQWVCHWAEHCNDLESFGGRLNCAQTCRERLAAGNAVNLACYASSCSARARCTAAATLGVPPACRELCRYARACPQYLALNLPADERACEVICAGEAAAFPTFAEALPCLARNAASCDLDRQLACLRTGEIFCPALCEEVAGCNTYFPSREDCYQHCNALSPARAWLARRCFDAFECRGGRACLDVPMPPACLASAEVALRTCRERTWPPSAQLLAADCAISVALDGLEPESDPAGCARRSGSAFVCREPSETDPFACTVRPPPACTRICDAVRACPGVEPRPGCEEGCVRSIWRTDRMAIGKVEECVRDAACDPARIELCLANAHNVSLCDRYCRLVGACEPMAAQGCLDGCAAALRAGDRTRLTVVTCAGNDADACTRYEMCRTAQVPDDDPACLPPCDRARGTCHHLSLGRDTGETACVTVCSELLRRAGRTGDRAAAVCVVGDLDHECRPQGLARCL